MARSPSPRPRCRDECVRILNTLAHRMYIDCVHSTVATIPTVVDEASLRVTNTHNPLGVSTQRVSGHASLERRGTRRVTRWWSRSGQEAGKCLRASYNKSCDLGRLVPLVYLLPIVTSGKRELLVHRKKPVDNLDELKGQIQPP